MLEFLLGKQGEAERRVQMSDTAASVASGLLPVFATPAMIAMMEEAAYLLVQPHLEQGQTTVGTAIKVTHTSATPLGYRVWAQATLSGIEGKLLRFEITAYDETGEIGSGTHTRVLINEARFMEKLNAAKPMK